MTLPSPTRAGGSIGGEIFVLRDMRKRGNLDRLPAQLPGGVRGEFRLASATRRR